MSFLKLISENKNKIFYINSGDDICTFSTSFNVPIEIFCKQFNIKNESGDIIVDLVSELTNLKLIQNECLRSYNGIILNDNSNHKYEQLLKTRKLKLTNNSAIFINSDEDYQYLRKLNNDYYLIVLVETDGNLIINEQIIQNNSWYVIKYTQNPSDISSDSNHFNLIDISSILFISEDTKKIGSQKYPTSSNIEYF